MLDLLRFMQKDGYLSSEELTALRKTCRHLQENPVRVLRSLNIASPEQIQLFLKKHFKVLTLKPQSLLELSTANADFIPKDLALFYSCFGVTEENGVLFIAMEDPLDKATLHQLRFFLDKRIMGISATVYDLHDGLMRIYNCQETELKLTTALEKSRGLEGGYRYSEDPIFWEPKAPVVVASEPSKPTATPIAHDQVAKAPQTALTEDEGMTSAYDQQRLAAVINLLLVKLALAADQQTAIELFARELSAIGLTFTAKEYPAFEFSGPDFALVGSWDDLGRHQRNSLYRMIMPILKKISNRKEGVLYGDPHHGQ